MKFMGSKRWMLSNGLGKTLSDAAATANRFADLFTGSSAVAAFIATSHKVPVIAADLQKFSVVLAGATLHREGPIATDVVWNLWKERAEKLYRKSQPFKIDGTLTKKKVDEARIHCQTQNGLVITKAYGGHYFSPEQATWIDAFRQCLPERENERSVALAALIEAGSKCAAAPGHTAQPFQPTKTAKVFLEDAWRRNVTNYLLEALKRRAGCYALKKGQAVVEDALGMARKLKRGDVAFIDPPYSGVHYSRFYHVLETIAAGSCGEVRGIGRYPDVSLRPRSEFSMKTTSHGAMERLLDAVAENNVSAIITFPDHECSNGLSGEDIRSLAKRNFDVTEKVVTSKFSTLGGTKSDADPGNNRSARHQAKELILMLTPKS